MEPLLTELVEKLKKTFEERLVSVILYGSAADGDHHRKYSDLNVLCVLARITPVELGDSERIFHWWREQGNPVPLLLTETEVHTSTDCFPIEFQDMKDRRRVLYGVDVIDNLEIDRSFYRAQVEHELRAKMLRLRQQAAQVLSKSDALLRLCIDSVSTFCVLGRHALLLAGIDASWHKREIVQQLGDTAHIDTAPFNTLLELREEKKTRLEIEAGPLFEQYLKQVQAMVEFVDRLEK
ncbi:MAG: nucleotidyltransferase domain-containing protein [Bryobacteraceae bacterium]